MRVGKRKEILREKEGRLFEKKARSKLRQKLSAASRKAGEKANIDGNSDKHTIPLSRIVRKTNAEKL